jgi:hypothetical protein
LVCIGGAWLITTAIGAFFYREWRLPAVAAALVAVTVVASWFGLTNRVSLWASSSALADVADTCTSTDAGWVGTVRLESVEKVDEVCLLYTKGGFIDRTGYALLPDGPPPDARTRLNVTFTRFSGDWYRFIWHF